MTARARHEATTRSREQAYWQKVEHFVSDCAADTLAAATLATMSPRAGKPPVVTHMWDVVSLVSERYKDTFKLLEA